MTTSASIPVNTPEAQLDDRAQVPEIEGYEILALAGRGGMSVVYKANQIALNRVVAIKMLHSTLEIDPAGLQRLCRKGGWR